MTWPPPRAEDRQVFKVGGLWDHACAADQNITGQVPREDLALYMWHTCHTQRRREAS